MYNSQYTSSKTHTKGVRSREEGGGEGTHDRYLISLKTCRTCQACQTCQTRRTPFDCAKREVRDKRE